MANQPPPARASPRPRPRPVATLTADSKSTASLPPSPTEPREEKIFARWELWCGRFDRSAMRDARAIAREVGTPLPREAGHAIAICIVIASQSSIGDDDGASNGGGGGSRGGAGEHRSVGSREGPEDGTSGCTMPVLATASAAPRRTGGLALPPPERRSSPPPSRLAMVAGDAPSPLLALQALRTTSVRWSDWLRTGRWRKPNSIPAEESWRIPYQVDLARASAETDAAIEAALVARGMDVRQLQLCQGLSSSVVFEIVSRSIDRIVSR